MKIKVNKHKLNIHYRGSQWGSRTQQHAYCLRYAHSQNIESHLGKKQQNTSFSIIFGILQGSYFGYSCIPLPPWSTLSLRIIVVLVLRGSSLKLRFASYVNTVFPRTSAPARLKGQVLIEGGRLIREALINFSFFTYGISILAKCILTRLVVCPVSSF